MHHSIEPHELTRIDLARFHVVQVSDGTFTVVLWEAPERVSQMRTRDRAGTPTLTIRLCDPLNPVRRKDVCDSLRASLSTVRFRRHRVLSQAVG